MDVCDDEHSISKSGCVHLIQLFGSLAINKQTVMNSQALLSHYIHRLLGPTLP